MTCESAGCTTRCGCGDSFTYEIFPSEGNKMTIYNTTVKTKQEHFKKFAELIENQFKHGGDKYVLAGFPDREGTDVISAVFGGPEQNDWVLGTIVKYVFRFKNFRREKDLLKIATYCFILYLKNGYHLAKEHDQDVTK